MTGKSHRWSSHIRDPCSRPRPRFGLNPGLSSAVTGLDTVVPASAVRQGNSARAAHNVMIGATVASVLMASLLLLGIIFCLRRCVNKKSSNLAVNMTRATSGVSPQTTEQQEGNMIVQGRNSFLDRSDTSQRDSTPTVATAQGQCSQPARSSQISIASSISRSIRFAVTGNFYSPPGSYIPRATMSVIAVDGTHTPGDDISGEPVSPWRPVSLDTSCDYSASWRGANLSNIINAARGIKS